MNSNSVTFILMFLKTRFNNFDPTSTMQVVNALIKASKGFEYVFLPGLKHTSGGVYGDRKRRDFFVKH
jgi:hypothetical protein